MDPLTHYYPLWLKNSKNSITWLNSDACPYNEELKQQKIKEYEHRVRYYEAMIANPELQPKDTWENTK